MEARMCKVLCAPCLQRTVLSPALFQALRLRSKRVHGPEYRVCAKARSAEVVNAASTLESRDRLL